MKAANPSGYFNDPKFVSFRVHRSSNGAGPAGSRRDGGSALGSFKKEEPRVSQELEVCLFTPHGPCSAVKGGFSGEHGLLPIIDIEG